MGNPALNGWCHGLTVYCLCSLGDVGRGLVPGSVWESRGSDRAAPPGQGHPGGDITPGRYYTTYLEHRCTAQGKTCVRTVSHVFICVSRDLNEKPLLVKFHSLTTVSPEVLIGPCIQLVFEPTNDEFS